MKSNRNTMCLIHEWNANLSAHAWRGHNLGLTVTFSSEYAQSVAVKRNVAFRFRSSFSAAQLHTTSVMRCIWFVHEERIFIFEFNQIRLLSWQFAAKDMYFVIQWNQFMNFKLTNGQHQNLRNCQRVWRTKNMFDIPNFLLLFADFKKYKFSND